MNFKSLKIAWNGLLISIPAVLYLVTMWAVVRYSNLAAPDYQSFLVTVYTNLLETITSSLSLLFEDPSLGIAIGINLSLLLILTLALSIIADTCDQLIGVPFLRFLFRVTSGLGTVILLWIFLQPLKEILYVACTSVYGALTILVPMVTISYLVRYWRLNYAWQTKLALLTITCSFPLVLGVIATSLPPPYIVVLVPVVLWFTLEILLVRVTERSTKSP